MQTPGPYEAIVLADSIADGVRLTTLCATFPRIVLAEFNTHRVFSRNSASSRAIPVEKRIKQVRKDPYIPLQFGANKSGMQAQEKPVKWAWLARWVWLAAMWCATFFAGLMRRIGLHKQWANRLIEPFAWHTVIVSSTEWDNYWALRISEYAQPEIRKVSEAMKAAMDKSEPRRCLPGDWHLPLVEAPRSRWTTAQTLVKLSVSRCAAVSYERHMETNVAKDLDRYEKLRSAGHMSPFEHAAVVGHAYSAYGHMVRYHGESEFGGEFIGNFRAPWIQHRKLLPGEAVFGS